MARSIHITRQDLSREESFIYSDPGAHTKRLTYLREELETKRLIKQIGRDQHDSALPMPASADDIPIRVSDEGEFIHYSASIDDIREIIKRLPVGVLDGITSIELCLGINHQRGIIESYMTADPLTGRVGHEMLPGVYTGACLGVYYRNRPKISVFAHVFDPSLPNRDVWEIILRLGMLSTFVHEAAHHFDATMRTDSRWRWDNPDRVEVYAQRTEYDWVPMYVIPYLEERYPEQVRRFQEWIRYYGGAEIPLKYLVDEPNWLEKGKLYIPMSRLFGISDAISSLARDAANDVELIRMRLGFAFDLHCSENYDIPLEIIERVLREYPDDVEALTLKADIFIHQERYDEAEPLLYKAISIDGDDPEAWRHLANLHKFKKEWSELLLVANHILDTMCEYEDYDTLNALENSARAYMELGDYENCEIRLTEMADYKGIIADRKLKELRGDLAKRMKRSVG